MKFKVAELITRIDAAIAHEVAATEKLNKKTSEQRAKDLDKWQKKYMPLWMQTVKIIMDCNRTGEPFTKDLLPEEFGRAYSLPFWEQVGGYTEQKPRIGTLTAVRAALVATTDTEVTSTGLKEMGFKDISFLFRVDVK